MLPAPNDVHLSVIVPAFNEAGRLPALLADASGYLAERSWPAELLVVDDGSTDGTADVARGFEGGDVPVRLVQHPDRRNHGKGAAVRVGMLAAVGRFRLFMDADNSTTIDQTPGMLETLETGGDVAVGSRRAPGAEIAVPQDWHRVVAGQLGNLVIQGLLLPGLADTQAGFKAFRAECAEAVFSRLTVRRWAFDVEALVIARHLGFEICEVPIRWENSAASKIVGGDYLRFLLDLWRIRRNVRAGRYD